MTQQYVEQYDGGYWVAGTRVSLDSVVYAFLEGLSPESIVDSFETLTLEQVYGALAYYLYLCVIFQAVKEHGGPRK